MERKAALITRPVLGIESSCDETAAAVLAPDGRILAELVLSQIADHAAFGGVVPEIAARAHLSALPALVRDALREAGLGFADLAAIAATAGPGLIGGLLVGSGYAKGAAIAAGLPYLAINHLEAHALTARLPGLSERRSRNFPICCCCSPAGIASAWRWRGWAATACSARTLDDAVGEAFDKTAKLLGLPYPGGPALEAAARAGDPARYPLPRPLLRRPGCDFSFSGLKTAVAQLVAAQPAGPLPQPLGRGHRRQLSGGGDGHPGRPAGKRSGRCCPRRQPSSSPAVSPPMARSAPASATSPRGGAKTSSRRRCACAPTMR